MAFGATRLTPVDGKSSANLRLCSAIRITRSGDTPGEEEEWTSSPGEPGQTP